MKLAASSVAMKNTYSSQPIISSRIFATVVFVITEAMFFAGLISSFLVIKAGRGEWTIPDHIKLPVMTTGFNTFVLFLSGYYLFVGGQKLKSEKTLELTRSMLAKSAALGGAFVAFQGYEWVQLIQFGFTMKSSIFGGLFFLMIGTHAVHALAGALVLSFFWLKSEKGLRQDTYVSLQIFWYFIVGIWPLLYGLVYF